MQTHAQSCMTVISISKPFVFPFFVLGQSWVPGESHTYPTSFLRAEGMWGVSFSFALSLLFVISSIWDAAFVIYYLYKWNWVYFWIFKFCFIDLLQINGPLPKCFKYKSCIRLTPSLSIAFFFLFQRFFWIIVFLCPSNFTINLCGFRKKNFFIAIGLHL